ncbi:MAG TPA: hypothetical protein VKM93_06700 [Terriglobia bacterium]|nr:hypothetical protein [Terriglobia bacterium]
MAGPLSRRAEILRRLVPFIDLDDWADAGDFTIFGVRALNWQYPLWALEPRQGAPHSRLEKETDVQTLQSIASEAKARAGRRFASERTELGHVEPADFWDYIYEQAQKRLSPEGYAAFTQDILRASRATPQEDTGRTDAIEGARVDALDCKYSNEVLEKLEGIVARSSALERVSLQAIPNRRVQVCFEEAHRCYLYGFMLATAALCRSILESALIEKVDPERKLSYSKANEDHILDAVYRLPDKSLPRHARDKVKSHILNMIYKARKDGILPEPWAGWAEEVREAGGAAVHKSGRFASDWPDERVEEVFLHTREILCKLYGRSEDAP